MKLNKLDGLRHSLLSAAARGDRFILSMDDCKYLAEYIEYAVRTIEKQKKTIEQLETRGGFEESGV